MPVTDFP
jgi:hypothetical protein